MRMFWIRENKSYDRIYNGIKSLRNWNGDGDETKIRRLYDKRPTHFISHEIQSFMFIHAYTTKARIIEIVIKLLIREEQICIYKLLNGLYDRSSNYGKQ